MIEKSIHEKLRKKYNPDGSKIRNSQMATLEVLKYIKRICEENNIIYWIASGTLLGAVRHGGFIPWDDDIDIEIPVSERSKLKKIIQKEDIFDWHDNTTDPHYWQRFPKIRSRESIFYENANQIDKQLFRGCFVDVFPVEKMPDFFVKIAAFLLTSPTSWHNSNNAIKLTFANIIFRFGQYVIIPILRIISNLLPNTYFHHSFGTYFPKRREITDSFETIDIEFENILFKAPRNYSNYLESIYGKNYMELPEESKRINHC